MATEIEVSTTSRSTEDRVEVAYPLWLLAGLLLTSGACALIFQIVWMREFRLIFGATTSASGAVVAIFMAGLGLGNFVLGQYVDRQKNPLMLYGIFELGIAITSAVSPFLLDALRSTYVQLGGQATMGMPLATAVRLLGATAVLILPTFLMGGTLPACARAVTRHDDERRRGVALLYGLNTIGAVIGASLGNFVLLEMLGNRHLLWAACLVNTALAATAVIIASKRGTLNSEAVPPRQPLLAVQSIKALPAHFYTICCISALVGFVFFLMEIVWYRMLGPLLGGTTYTFALILCMALAGIGIGGALYSILAGKCTPSLRLLALTCALEALFLGLPFFLGDQIAIWLLQKNQVETMTFALQVWNWTCVAAIVVLPASIVAGFQFPVLIAAAGPGRESIGKHVGWIFAANTLGAITGSLAGGFFLLPLVTAPGLWQVCAILLSVAAILLVLSRRGFWTSKAVVINGSLLAVLSVFSLGPTAVWRHSGIGARRAYVEKYNANGLTKFQRRQRRLPIWTAEGRETSIAINATDSLSFVVNGKSDGNAYGDARTQVGSGLLGPLLLPNPQRGLVIGLGTGETAGWLASVETMKAVDVVELEPSIITMANYCSPMNQNVLDNGKINLYINDAREFLLTSQETYDLILSEPSNPYRAGVANLFTREFYLSVMQRLSEQGLFLQWMQGYEVDARTVEIAIRSVRSVFPEMQIWQTQARDIMFVCGREGAFDQLDEAGFRQRLNDPIISFGLRNTWRTDDMPGAVAHYVCSTRTVDDMLQSSPGPVNTDHTNLLEFAFAKSLGGNQEFSLIELGSRAEQLDDHAPFTVDETTWETIVARRIAMYVRPGSYVPPLPNLDAEQQLLSDLFNYYLARSYAEAVPRLEQIQLDLQCPIQSLVAAQIYADQGIELPHDVLAAVRARNPTEALMIEAWSAIKRGELTTAREKTLVAFQSLKESPWGLPQVLELGFKAAMDLGEEDAAFANELFVIVSQPFSVFRQEELRQTLRYILASQLDSEKLLQVIESFEPNPLWEDWFLEKRVELYEAAEHSALRRAQRDLGQFRLNQQADLLRLVPAE